jgi:hypothetical protein
MSSGGGFSCVYVTDDDDVNVSLFLSHFTILEMRCNV